MQPDPTAGQEALALARAALDTLLEDLARTAGGGGRVSLEALQPHQEAAYRMVSAHARLFAAESLSDLPAGGEAHPWLQASFFSQALEMLQGQLHTLGARAGGALPPALARFLNAPALAEGIRAGSGDDFNRRVAEVLSGEGGGPPAGLDEDMRMLHGTFRAFAERKVRPVAESLHREDRLIPDNLIAEAAELGCFGLSIPADFGGVAERPDSLGMVVTTEALSWGALIFGSLITRPEILARALLQGGTAAQQARFLPVMASGEKMVAISVTEPDHGSDVGGLTLQARETAEGWRLNGAKMWSTFAGRAELLAVLARTEPDRALGHKGLSLFVVEKPAFSGHDFEHAPPGGGSLRGRAIATLGYRGMHSYELEFTDYLVPADNLVGGPAGRGRGFYLQMEGFSYGRLQTAGRALGVMQAAYEQARDYAGQRQVFGQKLRELPLVRSKLVGMAAALHASRQATYRAARLMDAGGGPQAAALVKLFTGHQAEWITREAMQLHGGMGYAEEFPVSRLFADARVLSIFEGTEEVLALRVILPALLSGQAPA